jgi:alpha-galactosidase/6-phospho-beta-glucosidase family protein
MTNRSLLWFQMALVPAIQALLGAAEPCLYISEINGTDIPGLPPETVVEKKSRVSAQGVKMIPFTGPPPVRDGPLEPFLRFLREVAQYEAAALEAALDPSEDKIIKALGVHPLGIEEKTARALFPLVVQEVGEIGASDAAEKGIA